MKTWHIQTWGAGTPHYLVSAEDEYNAWMMVQEAWEKKYDSPLVGGYESVTRGYIYQRILSSKAFNLYKVMYCLIEIEGLTTQNSLIVDLNEDN